ncbi:MAG: HAMP domain-containing histidine kinase [Marmoricola sp.]|nr:HAMP domain-containing histidine kinase [Marmoricola sp.]
MSSATLGWRPSRRLSGRALQALWLVCLPVTIGALYLQHLSTLQVAGAGSIRAISAVAVLWLVLGWLWPTRALRPVMLTVTALLLLATVTVGQVVVGHDVLVSLRLGAAVVVQAGVTLAYYRWRVGDDNLVPHRPVDVVDLLVAAVLGALVVVLVGPASHLWVTSGLFAVFWWTALNAAYVFVAVACTMLLIGRSPRTEAEPTQLLLVYVQLVVTAGCLALVFGFDHDPLTWLVLLPAIWAGMTMGPWTSAAYGLTVALAVVVAQQLSAARTGTDHRSDLVLVDSLMAAFVFVVLLLSSVRDQRAYLAREVVRHRQEAIDQAGLLSTVFESISDALVLMDPSGAVQLHNGAAVELLGHDRVATEPARWLHRMHDQAAFTYSFNRDGSEEGLRMLAVQLADVQYAGAGGIVAIARDVTTEQRRIEELTSFAAVAAHDLKSPLAAVQGWIEVAEDALGNDTITASQALERGRSASDRMSREIDDWLTYNVAREGTLQPDAVSLQPVVDSIVATYPGGDFLVETPDTVRADPTLLRHLLVNLVGNAVKYTRPGEKPIVTIRSFATRDGNWVRLYVVDAGIGIPEGEESLIFEPFRRATGVEANYDGSGLGLALAKRIVRRHGGTISASRNEGPGSTFTVTLPRA